MSLFEILSELLLTVIVFLLVYWLYKKIKLLDKPDPSEGRKPVPTMLGVAVFFSFLFGSFLSPDLIHTNLWKGLFIGNLLIFFVSLVDELSFLGKIKIKVSPFFRLIIQLISALISFYIADFPVKTFVIHGQEIMIPMWLFALFFIIRVIVVVNAINWFDGVYGQASGISFLGFLTIFLLIKFVVLKYFADITPQHLEYLNLVSQISLLFAIISLVSVVFEFKPLGLLRDVGVMVFGFSLAYLSVAGGVKIGTLAVTLSLPLFDAVWVVFYRIFVLKKSPLKGDYRHLHHRLLRFGLSKTEIRVLVWRYSFVMMILMILQGVDRLGKIIIFGLMFITFFVLHIYLFLVKKLPCGFDKEKE